MRGSAHRVNTQERLQSKTRVGNSNGGFQPISGNKSEKTFYVLAGYRSNEWEIEPPLRGIPPFNSQHGTVETPNSHIQRPTWLGRGTQNENKAVWATSLTLQGLEKSVDSLLVFDAEIFSFFSWRNNWKWNCGRHYMSSFMSNSDYSNFE